MKYLRNKIFLLPATLAPFPLPGGQAGLPVGVSTDLV